MSEIRAVVVPCYDEAARLDEQALALLAERLDVVLVDDGSRDGTAEILAAFAARHGARVVTLPENRGKAEAVRAGLREALAGGATVVGYADADLATPAEEILRLADELQRTGAKAVLGSRIRLLGTDVRRKAYRHYLGRAFATAASLALDLPVYDTQCGAKFFRAGPELTAALARPFESRWAFDVELLARLLEAGWSGGDFVEVPLRRWRDVGGSRLSAGQAAGAALELAKVAIRLRRRR